MRGTAYPLTREDSILFVVDIQEKLAAAMAESDRALVYSNTNRLIEGCSLLSVPVSVTEQYPKGLGPTVSDIQLSSSIPRFKKNTFDALCEPAFAEHLASSGRRSAIVAGMETHICVFFTAMHLLEEGYRVAVVSDAVCSRSVSHRDTALLQLRQSGCLVVPAETVLFSLTERGGTDQFRKISSLVKK